MWICTESLKYSGWWFQTWKLLSISYMGYHPSHCGTHIFSRWLLHHQPVYYLHLSSMKDCEGIMNQVFVINKFNRWLVKKSMPQWHQLQEAVSKMEGAKLQNILFGRCFGTCFYVSIDYWEFHHPNWRRNIFQRGRYTTNQRISCEFYPLVN